MPHFLHQLVAHRPKKPRTRGLTFATDRLDLAPSNAMLEFVDVAKIGWGLPALLDQKFLARRIEHYHRGHVLVTSGGTLTEYAMLRRAPERYLDALATVGFDAVEVSESRIHLDLADKRALAKRASRRELRVAVKVGKKAGPMGVRELEAKLEEALAVEPWRIVIEAGEGTSSTLFDATGAPRWEMVDLVRDRVPERLLVIEAPQRHQRSALILRVGPDVNLGGVPLGLVPELETQRLGIIAGETFGLEERSAPVVGGPAAKFVHFLIAANAPIGQETLVRLSGLPRRTVQSAVETLRKGGRIHEEIDRADMRRRVYRIAT